jgi:cytochrome b561
MTAAASAAPRRLRAPRRTTYSRAAIVLHWLIAALILTNIGLAWWFTHLKGPAEVAPLAVHKSIGITVLLLTLVRVGVRLAIPPPPLPAHMPAWERLAARSMHTVFYLLILGLPLSGWAMVSASPLIRVHPTVLYGVVPWPAVPFAGLTSDQLHDAHRLFERTHNTLAWIAYFAISLHVLAALKHQFLDHDEVLGRMLPWLARWRTEPK